MLCYTEAPFANAACRNADYTAPSLAGKEVDPEWHFHQLSRSVILRSVISSGMLNFIPTFIAFKAGKPLTTLDVSHV